MVDVDQAATTEAPTWALELPFSVVKRIAKQQAGDVRFAPAAVEYIGLQAEGCIDRLGYECGAVALADGRKTVQLADVEAVLAMRKAADAPEEKPGRPLAGSLYATALARANEKLRKAGLKPELLGQFDSSEDA